MVVPSTGKTITYRPYLLKEEKMLLQALSSNNQTELENTIKQIGH